ALTDLVLDIGLFVYYAGIRWTAAPFSLCSHPRLPPPPPTRRPPPRLANAGSAATRPRPAKPTQPSQKTQNTLSLPPLVSATPGRTRASTTRPPRSSTRP